MKNKNQKTGSATIEKHVGARLQQLRHERGLSLEEMDRRIGARKGATRAFEEGKRILAPGHLLAFSRALQEDISLFFENIERHDLQSEIMAPAPDVVADAQRLLKAYYQIDDPGLRRHVFDLLRDIARDPTLGIPDA